MKAKASWWGSRLARQSMRAVVAYRRHERTLPHTAQAQAAGGRARARTIHPSRSHPRRRPLLRPACRLSLSLSLASRGVSPSVARPPGTSLPSVSLVSSPRLARARALSPPDAAVCTYARPTRRAVLLFEPGRQAGRPAERSLANTIRSYAASRVCVRVCIHAPAMRADPDDATEELYVRTYVCTRVTPETVPHIPLRTRNPARELLS